MKTTRKKIIGGLIIVSLLATIGTILVSAQDEDVTDDENQQSSTPGFWCRDSMRIGSRNLFYELTDEQEEQIVQLKETMLEQGANLTAIREAIQQKLDEWGIFDQRLDDAIEQTEQRLQILNREKELRDEGYDWEEIQDIIEEEFGVTCPIGINYEMHPGFGPGPHQRPRKGFCWNSSTS